MSQRINNTVHKTSRNVIVVMLGCHARSVHHRIPTCQFPALVTHTRLSLDLAESEKCEVEHSWQCFFLLLYLWKYMWGYSFDKVIHIFHFVILVQSEFSYQLILGQFWKKFLQLTLINLNNSLLNKSVAIIDCFLFVEKEPASTWQGTSWYCFCVVSGMKCQGIEPLTSRY